jgi:hypothetical protein
MTVLLQDVEHAADSLVRLLMCSCRWLQRTTGAALASFLSPLRSFPFPFLLLPLLPFFFFPPLLPFFFFRPRDESELLPSLLLELLLLLLLLLLDGDRCLRAGGDRDRDLPPRALGTEIGAGAGAGAAGAAAGAGVGAGSGLLSPRRLCASRTGLRLRLPLLPLPRPDAGVGRTGRQTHPKKAHNMKGVHPRTGNALGGHHRNQTRMN